jgi:NCK-associated protein 1
MHKPRWSNLCDSLHAFLIAYEQPAKALLAELNPSVSQGLGDAITDLAAPFLACTSVDQMRKIGVLSMTVKPDEMCYPPISQQQMMARLSPKLYTWVVYGLLLAPEQFAMPEVLELLKLALVQSYIAPLYLNEVCFIHAEYDVLFSTYKSANKLFAKQFKKDKKVVTDMLPLCVQPTQGPKLRADRRAYIRHELRQLVLLCKDYPGLLGPKIGIVWAALAMAREEVLWYFAHRTNPPPRGTKGYQERLYHDPHITELIYWMEEMASVVRQYRNIIEQYHLEYLCGADLNQASELINGLMAKGAKGKVADVLQSILSDLMSISVERYLDGSSEYSFQSLRLNWFRIETWLASPGCPAGDIAQNSKLTHRMELVIYHSK